MALRFTLGIEEGFQGVKKGSGELCSCAQSILEKDVPLLDEKLNMVKFKLHDRVLQK